MTGKGKETKPNLTPVNEKNHVTEVLGFQLFAILWHIVWNIIV